MYMDPPQPTGPFLSWCGFRSVRLETLDGSLVGSLDPRPSWEWKHRGEGLSANDWVHKKISYPVAVWDCGGFGWQLFSGIPKRAFPIFESFSKHPILTSPVFFGVEIGEPTRWWSMTIGDSVCDLEWSEIHHYLGFCIFNQAASLQGFMVVNNPTYIYLEPFHDPSFGWSLGLVLRGWPSKIEVIWIPGSYQVIQFVTQLDPPS